MDNPIVLPAAAFAGVLAVMLLVSNVMGRGGARRRLDDHAVNVKVSSPRRLERRNVLREQHYSSFGPLNAILRRLRPAHTAASELMQANAALSVTQYFLLRLLVTAVVVYAVWVGTGQVLLAVLALPVVLMAPRLLLFFMARRRRKAFEGQLAEAIDLMVGALRAGFGFLQSIETVSSEMPNPTREEFGRVLEKINVGASPVAAMQELPGRIASYDLEMFVTAVTVQRNVGGNLAEVLENIAETVRERRRIRGEVRAITTGPRVSSYILGLFPIGLMLFFMTTDPDYRQIMTEELIGKMMIGFAVVWSLIGFVLSTLVSKVEY